MTVRKIKTVCPYCGGTEFVRGGIGNSGAAARYKTVYAANAGQRIQCQICKNCGTVIREFIVHPEKLPDY